MSPLIVHVAQIQIAEESGMGRVAWHWRKELENRGYEFLHIGSEHVPPRLHPGLFPFTAYRRYRKLGRRASLFLLHEPSAGIFTRESPPAIVFSHGIERRGWRLALEGRDGAIGRPRLRTRLAFPIWRLRQCDLGLRKAGRLLLINREDADFAQQYYRRDANRVFVFRNGVYPSRLTEEDQPRDGHTVLFLGSWLERKGARTLVEAARILDQQGVSLSWLIAGTGLDPEAVLGWWPPALRRSIEVISQFRREGEESLFARASLFILPSFFEGQPLALLQAMECGRCCITTNCCGQRDVIQHRHNGLLHEPGDARQLASLIKECVRDRENRMALGRNAKQSVKDRSWEAVSSEVADVVNRALEADGIR